MTFKNPILIVTHQITGAGESKDDESIYMENYKNYYEKLKTS